MMFSPPFWGGPFHRRFPPPYYEPTIRNAEAVDSISENKQTQLKGSSGVSDIGSEKRILPDSNPQIFNIMGISLAFDDILIICLLFFLYSEGVKDEMLFVVLVLLLLS